MSGASDGLSDPASSTFSRRDLVRGAVGGAAAVAGIAGLFRESPLVVSARAAADRVERVARFNHVRGVAASRNPIGSLIDDDLYGATAPGTVEAIGTAPTVGYRVISASQSPELFRLFGGQLHKRYDDWQAKSVSYPDGHVTQNSGRVGFITNSRHFDLIVGASATASYRVLVDGQYLTRESVLTATPQGARQYLHVNIDEPPYPRRLRRIDVEMFSAEGAFSGVALPPQAVLQSAPECGYRIACFGDSLAAGTGALNQNDSWVTVAGYLLGGVELDMLQVALGGTGYIHDGPTWRGIRHLRDLAAQPIDEVWVELGMNDASYSSSEVTPAALEFLKAARAMLPGVPILVCGIARDDSERAFLLEHAIYEAFRIWGDELSFWVPLQAPGTKVFTGRIEGIGNFVPEGYGGGLDSLDNTHPNVRGHLHLARFVATRRSGINF